MTQWKLVPIKPTSYMTDVAFHWLRLQFTKESHGRTNPLELYRKMLNAAPAPEVQPVAWMNNDGHLTHYRQGDAQIPLYAHPPSADVQVLLTALREIQKAGEDCADADPFWPHSKNYRDFAEHAKKALAKWEGK